MGIGGLLALILVLAVVLNIAKFAIYPDYFAMETNVCRIPGIRDGLVCQSLTVYEPGGSMLISGYMSDGSPSRIYVTDNGEESHYVSLQTQGQAVYGHFGGITTSGGNVYVASDYYFYVVSLQDILDAENGAAIEVAETYQTDNACASAYADDNYLYLGEFHNGVQISSYHPYDTPDGRYHAIIGRYRLEDLNHPDKVYAIRDKVQGICFTPDGKVVLSASYALADSHYYVYEEDDAIDSGLTHDGAPVYYLCDYEKDLKGPAMVEGLEYYNGKLLTLTESASHKYLFGKLFFADKIVSLDLLSR